MVNLAVSTHALTTTEQHELRELAGRAHALYEGLMALPEDAVEYRRDVWSEIVEIQDRITTLIRSQEDTFDASVSESRTPG